MKIKEGDISVGIYRKLRIQSGLSGKNLQAAEAGLKNSVHSVMIQNDREIIGDGGCFCQIVDICTLSEYQRQRIDKMIMEILYGLLRRNYLNFVI